MSRNPLFIKSEFSHSKEVVDKQHPNRVAILYSSSQNSLIVVKSGSHFRRASLMSQSFIHQVRILSEFLNFLFKFSTHTSQSFIHQVRILSMKKVVDLKTLYGGRNPLFIKSEFSPKLKELKENSTHTDTSQSFIHQVRILSGLSFYGYKKRFADFVAILYSSSQNSLV